VLFASLFKKHDVHEQIISFIASKREGVNRSDIEAKLKYKGGRLTDRLKELEEVGFITSITPWKKERGIFYKVTDEYSLFYLTWIAPRAASRISRNIDERYWDVLSSKSTWKAWAGYTFETICFKHINQIKKALNIPDGSNVSSWRYTADRHSKEMGAQIDLVFDRPDKIVNLCKIKYSNSSFIIDKKYAEHLLNREKIYCKITKTKKQIFHSMIVSAGLKENMYSDAIISSFASLDDLFTY